MARTLRHTAGQDDRTADRSRANGNAVVGDSETGAMAEDGPVLPNRYDARLEERIAAMRAFLSLRGPGTDSEALRLLRTAFPDLPLAERVAAFGTWKA